MKRQTKKLVLANTADGIKEKKSKEVSRIRENTTVSFNGTLAHDCQLGVYIPGCNN